MRDQILTTLAIHQRLQREALIDIVCSHPDCDHRDMVEMILGHLIDEGAVIAVNGFVDFIPQVGYLEAIWLQRADDFRRDHPIPWYRRLRRWVHAHVEALLPGLVLIVCIVGITTGVVLSDVITAVKS